MAEERLASVREAVRRPLALPLALAAAAVAGSAYLWGHDPHEEGHLLPRCPFQWATGLLCPACGGTRMAYHLMHGEFAAAFQDNAVLLLFALPAAGYLWVRQLREGLRGRLYRPALGPRGAAAVVGVAVLWAVGRNVLGR